MIRQEGNSIIVEVANRNVSINAEAAKEMNKTEFKAAFKGVLFDHVDDVYNFINKGKKKPSKKSKTDTE